MSRHIGLRVGLHTVVVAALAAALVGAPVGPAAADPTGLEVVGVNAPATSNDKGARTRCPDGKVVTGGGGYLTGAPHVRGWVGLDRLEPSADGSSFIATMRETVSTSASWALVAKAICVPRPAGYQVVSATGASRRQWVYTPNCPEGKSVLGAGGRINGGSGDVVLDSVTPLPAMRNVQVRGVPIPGATDNSWSVTAFAICAFTPRGLERIWFTTATDSSSEKAVAARCPAGKALYGTGFDTFGAHGRVMATGLNIGPTDTVRAWADEIATGNTNYWRLTGIGICGS